MYSTKKPIDFEHIDLMTLKVGDTVMVLYPRWHDHCEFYRKHEVLETKGAFIIIGDAFNGNEEQFFRNVYKYTSDEDMEYANERLMEILPRFQTIAKLNGEYKCNHDVFKKSVRDIYVCSGCGLRRTIDDLSNL